MALAPRPHGVKITAVPSAERADVVIGTSIWGLVVTAADADADAFPLNKPVLVIDLEDAMEKAGVEGTLRRSLKAIADQARSIGVVVRVAEGTGGNPEDIAASMAANLIGGGSAGERTGMQALRDAETLTGVRPRILAIPGFSQATVATALGLLAGQLDAIAYFDAGPVRTVAAATAFSAGQTAKQLFLSFGDCLAFDPDAEPAGEAPSFATARRVGLRVKLDQTVGYHKTTSNVIIDGVTGVTTPVSWDLSDENTEVGLLNGGNVTPLVVRQGVRFWGNRGCSTDARFAFESAVRTEQVLNDITLQVCFPYIDHPLTPGLARDLIEELNAHGRREKAARRLMGVEFFLLEGAADQYAQGKLALGRRWTPVAPLEALGISSEITDEFYVDFNQQATAAG